VHFSTQPLTAGLTRSSAEENASLPRDNRQGGIFRGQQQAAAFGRVGSFSRARRAARRIWNILLLAIIVAAVASQQVEEIRRVVEIGEPARKRRAETGGARRLCNCGPRDRSRNFEIDMEWA